MTNTPTHLEYSPISNASGSAVGRETIATKDVPVMTVPTEDLHSPYSKLFQCAIVVEKNKFVMYYQHDDGTETPVLRADKQSTLHSLPKYHIFDISHVEGGCFVPLGKANAEYLGKIRRERKPFTHNFALHSEREEALSRKVLHVLYSVPSMTESLFGKQPPRKAQVALYHEASDSSERGNTLSDRVESSIKETNFLDRVADPNGGLYTFGNKEPFKNANGDFALNFYGRCSRANPSNMQMEDLHGRVIIQLSQCGEDNKFHLDFR